MSITSSAFLVFLIAVLILYYALPKKTQWMVLLAASIAFYALVSLKTIPYIFVTAATIYAATVRMQSLSDKQSAYLKENKATLSKAEKDTYKAAVQKKRKAWFLACLLLNLGLLCGFKYIHFLFAQVNGIQTLIGVKPWQDPFPVILPLGISFYTFQSVGYLINVYWKNNRAEKNPLKTLLFVTFFPQITQGPISEFSVLSEELFREHTFSDKNFSWGFQRLLWGLMKKMVIANMLAPMVKDAFANYAQYTGAAAMVGALLYSVQIYADFSGYMDIMCGLCQMLDIRLTENFERPYFSKSIAEYWRRWHISLGAWFKNYIYYPIGVSKWNRRLGKKTSEKFGRAVGKNLPASIALVAVWFCTGLWHGASWGYILWGGVNGVFIIFSMWMEPTYDKIKRALHIRQNRWLWRAFQTLRTFFLVTMIKVLPEVGSLRDGLGYWRQIFTEHTIPTSPFQLFPFPIDSTIKTAITFCMIGLLFVHSLLERKRDVRILFNRLPLIVRLAALALLMIVIGYIGIPASAKGEFMYAMF